MCWYRIFTQPCQQPSKLRSILSRHRIDFHPQPFTGSSVAHHRLDANLSFLNQEVEIEQISLTLSRTSLQEETGRAEIAYLGNISTGGRFPVNPQIVGNGDARRSSAGGAGCDLHRAHRLHPGPRIEFCWPGRGQLRTGCKFSQKNGQEVNGNYLRMRKLAGGYW